MRRPQGHKIINVFDTFEGLSEGTVDDGNAFKTHEGEYNSDFKILDDILKSKGLDSYVNFIIGDACKTCVEHFQKISLKKVSFALLDMDLYEPTKIAIESILPNLVPGGKIIFFDEATCEQWEGEQKALNYLLEMADEKNIKYTIKENSYTRQPTSIFTRVE